MPEDADAFLGVKPRPVAGGSLSSAATEAELIEQHQAAIAKREEENRRRPKEKGSTCRLCGSRYSIFTAELGSGLCKACSGELAAIRRAKQNQSKPKPILQPANDSAVPKDNILFYYKVKDEEKGPYTFGQLRSMWDNGNITADAVCRSSNSSEWLPLAQRLSDTGGVRGNPTATIGAAVAVTATPAEHRPQELTDARPMTANSVPTKKTIIPSAIMLISFFIPWFYYEGFSVNGAGVGKLGSLSFIVWIIPALSGATIAAGIMKVPQMNINIQKLLPRLTAASPYICLLILYMCFSNEINNLISLQSQMGQLSRSLGGNSGAGGSLLSLISVGVYTTIISSVWLGVVSFRNNN